MLILTPGGRPKPKPKPDADTHTGTLTHTQTQSEAIQSNTDANVNVFVRLTCRFYVSITHTHTGTFSRMLCSAQLQSTLTSGVWSLASLWSCVAARRRLRTCSTSSNNKHKRVALSWPCSEWLHKAQYAKSYRSLLFLFLFNSFFSLLLLLLLHCKFGT